MLRTYLKQALALMRQNKLFTSIYVVGTGLSLAMVMTLFIIFYVKCAPIYPEYNRNRTLIIKQAKISPKGKPENYSSSQTSGYLAHELLADLAHAEAVTAFRADEWDEYKVSSERLKETPVTLCETDWDFWRVFTFRFVSGKPYAREDVEGQVKIAVLSRTLAQRLFGTDEAEGHHFRLNGKEYRVSGVVEDVSNATPLTAAEVWVPMAELKSKWGPANNLIGNYYTALLACSAAEVDALEAEVDERVKQANLQEKEYEYDLLGQPEIYWKSQFRKDETIPVGLAEVLKEYGYVLLALLLIPALNLCGMIASRMDKRLCELGVRKAYGANHRQLVAQVLCENLLLTLMGGMVGLLLSYLIVLTASDWILTLFDSYVYNVGRNVSLTPEMLFNPWIFLCALAVCMLLNLVSAWIPAALSLRKNIVESLHSYRN